MKGQHEYPAVEKHSIHLVSDLLHKFSRWYELHKEREPAKSLVQMLAIGAGVGLMLLLTLLE